MSNATGWPNWPLAVLGGTALAAAGLVVGLDALPQWVHRLGRWLTRTHTNME